jgi:hypothetical protein
VQYSGESQGGEERTSVHKEPPPDRPSRRDRAEGRPSGPTLPQRQAVCLGLPLALQALAHEVLPLIPGPHGVKSSPSAGRRARLTVIGAAGIARPALRIVARTRFAALAHGRVREADRIHGRGNTTALAICLKYLE